MPEDTRSKSRMIRDALITELEKVQYKGESAFMAVTGSTKGEFQSYPAVRILPGDFENESTGMGEVERTVNFSALLHIEVASEGGDDPLGEAIDKMYDLTELIADQLDEADFNNRLDENEPLLDTLQVNTSMVDWDYFPGAAGTILLSAVRLSVRYSKDLNYDA